jgi:hypothetical protein
MCTHSHQQHGDPDAMERLVVAIEQLRADSSDRASDLAAEASQEAGTDLNPWTRSLARGVLTAVALRRAGRMQEADELIAGELSRALPAAHA